MSRKSTSCRSSLPLIIVVFACSTVVHGQSNGPIRLWRNNNVSLSYTFGRVQVFLNSQWGNICDDASFGIVEATVICHQLGYAGASSYSRASNDTFGTDTSPTVLSSVNCSTSSYLVILQCNYMENSPSSCTDSDDVSVTCFSTRIWDNPYLGQIRLTGGDTVNQGLVEVYCSGQWGTVCDDLFSKNDAHTVCRQLGYYGAFDYGHLSIRGNSSQPIWLDDVPCSSRRPCIGDCVGFCPVTHNCLHVEDITISCYSPVRYTETTNTTCSLRTSTGIRNGPVRLVRNGVTSLSYTSGRVQLVYNRRWGNINDCPDNFTITEATVICHQLGYTGASSYNRAAEDSFGIDDSLTVIYNVRCSTSAYLVILQCSYSSSSSCSDNSDDVAVYCYSTRLWENPYTLQVRLTGGATSNQGLVEVYCSGQWGTVCDDGFSWTDANIVCRQLGYYIAYRYDHLSIQGNSSQPIWLTNVPCYFIHVQSCLSDCTSCPSSPVTNCSHSDDITVECSSSVFATSVTNITCDGSSMRNGPIRLWRNGSSSLSYTAGRVQLVYNSQWGNICDDTNFRLYEATVICHQLGYTGASSYSRASSDTYGSDTSPTVIDNVICLSYYLVILQCSFSTIISSSCTDDNDVSVTCYSTRIWDNPYTLQVRLTGGATVNQGLVEVYCSGQWGTVCNDGFVQNEADTICRQLGYYSAYRYDHLSNITGSSSMPIVLDDVDCNGFPRGCIGYCQQCQSSHNCRHFQDVTIECYSPSHFTTYTTTSTCERDFGTTDSPSSGSPSFASIDIGAIVGGTIGGVVLLVGFVLILCYIIKQHKNATQIQNTARVNFSTTGQTVFSSAYTSVTTQPQQPQQPPAAFTLPRPEAAGSTFTCSYNQPTDPAITAAPPPSYGLHDDFTTITEEQSDLLPPSYSSET